jgi:hypothetical protein
MPNAELTFCKMRKTYDLCDSLRADATELQKIQQEEHDASHEADDSAPNFEFYDDEISRCKPGKRYFAPVNKHGKKFRHKSYLCATGINHAHYLCSTNQK